ncbi:L,D-transpeptidase family protein [Pedobacter sp. HMF7647]|uniref:L,D-transpeptidase family protein n=1 Tax=Hufsiella arboris TaxID=2695275 RepID=A0A7K1YF46_9SPHI|nr:L,D-transpeptidase family protein [Hufsiella arboris]MXV52609.1 L,D-transpeptidase family protein [Hufsiella arboris]
MTTRKLITLSTFVVLFIATLSSCKKPKSDFGGVLFKESRNKVYKQMNPDAFENVFKETLNQQLKGSSYTALIKNFYESKNYEPVFILNFTKGGGLKLPLDYYSKAAEHGLNPELFHYKQLQETIDKLYDKHGAKTLDEAYKLVADAEIGTAISLLKYSTGLQYGFVNPKNIFPRYFMKTAKPDSAFYNKVLNTADIKYLLSDVQPKNADYVKFQNALKTNYQVAGQNPDETKKIIEMNMERLRWKNMPDAEKYIYVNIPEYMLNVIDHGKSVLSMKVCVGKGPEQTLEEATYTGTAKVPRLHTTPQLTSEIYNAQVNPIWNIPQSIAKNEIYDHASNDPYYLVNNNIDVYDKAGNKLDSEDIDWSAVSKANLPYTFKQAPGDDNSLGKIKFQFPNSSSVYLHDTPAQQPFNLPVRAVSHGCVRLEKPLELAHEIYGDGAKFDRIKKELGEENPTSADISVNPKVPVVIDYRTAVVDENGNIKIVPDVYKLDNLLYNRMKKALL